MGVIGLILCASHDNLYMYLTEHSGRQMTLVILISLLSTALCAKMYTP